MLVRVLECLYQTKRFIHWSPHRKVIHGDLSKDSLIVNYEKAPVTNKFFFFLIETKPIASLCSCTILRPLDGEKFHLCKHSAVPTFLGYY